MSRSSKLLLALCCVSLFGAIGLGLYSSDKRAPVSTSPSANAPGVPASPSLPDGVRPIPTGIAREVEPLNLSPEETARIEARNADPNAVIPGETSIGEMAVTETVEQIMARAAAEPDASGAHAVKPELEIPWRKTRPSAEPLTTEGFWPPRNLLPQDLLHPGHGGQPLIPQTVSTSFDGDTISGGITPPDTIGDVGPTQYIICSNRRIRTFNKDGTLGSLSATLSSFFNSVRGGAGVGDPRIRFDRLTNRWFVIGITLSIPNRIVIAVSSGPTVTNTASISFFFFQHDTVGTTPNTDTGGLFDYPSLGVDPNALYIGGNIFNSALTAFLGTTGHVVRKSSVTGGGPIVVTAFRQLATASGTGPFAPRGVHNEDPSSTEGYFLGPDNAAFSRLILRRVSTPGGTPTISGNINIAVPTTTFPTNVAVLGSTANLDALDDRLYEAAVYHNQLTGTRTLWTAHNFRVNASGTATASGSRVASRWYELTGLTGSPSVVQSGTVFDADAADFDKYWIPSIAMSAQGHAVLACSVGATNRRAEIAVAGRLSSDTLGSMQTPIIAQTSSTNYNLESGVQRWGDYSSTNVDPADGMSIWTAQEYCNATNAWAVRVIKLLAPPPAEPVSAAPPTVNAGAAGVNVVVSGASLAGSGFFDPDPSYPNHISATVNGGDVTVNSITFTNPTTISLNINVGGAAVPGARTISVTNPDGQSLTSAGGILTIVPTCNLAGDVNVDTFIDGLDTQDFVDCLIFGSSSGNCACGDFDASGSVTVLDIPPFTAVLGV